MGKAYLNRKTEAERPLGDFYSTPRSLVKVLLNNNYFDPKASYLEPCMGDEAIASVLREHAQDVTAFDLYKGEVKQDFLTYNKQHDYIITNFPFSIWDECVAHGKKLARRKLVTVGRLNYLACTGRYKSGIWKGLSSIQTFCRMVDYRGSMREDGHFHVGGLVTAWFVWDTGFTGTDPVMKILDVQEFATLGAYKDGR